MKAVELRNVILCGDVREQLRLIPDETVNCVVTSPPYWGLRDYGTASWEGGDPDHAHRGRDERQAAPGSAKQASSQGANYVYAGDCSCGAVRVDNQIGLEPTPEEYVCNMVDVFREVRRVLRKDGTLWLNLGDSYASGGRTTYDTALVSASSGLRNSSALVGEKRPDTPPGLKPKDLVGIPWMVAKALQAPYYTGRIKAERDRVWLAAMIDGEGCMFIHRRKIGQNNGQGYARKSDTYGSGLEVANTSEAIVRRCMEITGKGSIVRQEKDRRQPLFRWNLRSNECRDVIREIYPYLVGKQHQARLLIACPSSGTEAERAHAGLIALHNGEPCDIDFPAPASLYEPGWYLRSDVIWSKSNPMPESVTDRPTKAHEYLFLLSKSERYYYDHEAILEPYQQSSIDRVNQPNFANQSGGQKDYGPDSNRSMRKTLENFAVAVARGPDGRKKTSVQGSDGSAQHRDGERWPNPAGRNRRTVWEIPTKPYPEAHFATYPEELVKPCILAGCPEGGIVLDPFLGSGTTASVAKTAGRDYIGIELNPAYVELAKVRINVDQERLL